MRFIFVCCGLFMAYTFTYGQEIDSLMLNINGDYEYCKVERIDCDEEGEYDPDDGDISTEFFYYSNGKIKEKYKYDWDDDDNYSLIKFDKSGNNISICQYVDEVLRVEVKQYFDTLDNCTAMKYSYKGFFSSTDSIDYDLKYDNDGKVIEKNIVFDSHNSWSKKSEQKEKPPVFRAYLAYDDSGKLIREEIYNEKHQLVSRKLIEYDENGREITITDNNTEQMTFYDDNGNIKSKKTKNFKGKILERKNFKFNKKNKKIEKKVFSDDYMPYMEKYFYNKDGNLSKVLVFEDSMEYPSYVNIFSYSKEYIPED